MTNILLKPKLKLNSNINNGQIVRIMLAKSSFRQVSQRALLEWRRKWTFGAHWWCNRWDGICEVVIYCYMTYSFPNKKKWGTEEILCKRSCKATSYTIRIRHGFLVFMSTYPDIRVARHTRSSSRDVHRQAATPDTAPTHSMNTTRATRVHRPKSELMKLWRNSCFDQ